MNTVVWRTKQQFADIHGYRIEVYEPILHNIEVADGISLFPPLIPQNTWAWIIYKGKKGKKVIAYGTTESEELCRKEAINFLITLITPILPVEPFPKQ